jgi:hypothetical protein
MTLLDQLVACYKNRKKAADFAQNVIKNHKQFDELMQLFLSDDNRICQMAAFPLLTIADSDITLLEPYLEELIKKYQNAPHDSFRRNVIRILQFVKIPESIEGEVYELCLKEFGNTKAPTAIRVFSATVLVNICEKHPDLKHELEPFLNDYLNTGTVGFENRLRKEIKRLHSIEFVD